MSAVVRSWLLKLKPSLKVPLAAPVTVTCWTSLPRPSAVPSTSIWGTSLVPRPFLKVT